MKMSLEYFSSCPINDKAPLGQISGSDAIRWNLGVVIMPTLVSLVAPDVVIMTIYGATSDHNLAFWQPLVVKTTTS